MAGKSTNSNETENTENGDSLADSEVLDSTESDSPENDDAPVVIEGDAKDITDEAVTEDLSEITQDDEVGDTSQDVRAEENAKIVAPAPAPAKRGSVVPLVFGGLVAGAIGYGASHFGFLGAEQSVSTDPETLAVDTSAMEARIDEIASEVGALSGGLEGLASDVAGIAPADTAPLTDRIDTLASDLEALRNTPVSAASDAPSTEMIERIEALEADVTTGMSGLTERIAGLEDRLADLQMAQEADPSGDMTEDELAAFQSELDALTADATAQVEEAKARASVFEKEAAEAAAMAERQGAIAALTSAVESGSPFADELGYFAEAPKALTAVADGGLPTLSALQREFPNAARAALSAATVVPQDASTGERLTAFLKRQTNARSLAPKEGDDTDAVLSRAEAKVAQGDLEGSLTELSTLSDDAQDVLGPWMTNAQARLDALAALNELTAAVN